MDIKQLQIGEEVSVLEIDPTQFEVIRFGKTAGYCVSMMQELIEHESEYHTFTPMHQFATMEQTARKIYRKAKWGLIATHGDVPAGLLLVSEKDPTHISSLVVTSSLRGRGVGQEMIRRLRYRLPDEAFTVDVHCRNTKALEFYWKIGFKLKPCPSSEGSIFNGMIPPLNDC